MPRWPASPASTAASWRWKAHSDLADRSTRSHRLATTMTDWEEALVVELRRALALPLDDITEAMRRSSIPSCRAVPATAVCNAMASPAV